MSELTYLLFLKIAQQTGRDVEIPADCQWHALRNHAVSGIVGHYRKMLTALGEDAPSPLIREIFGFPTTVFAHDENLHKVVSGIDEIDWKSVSGTAFGMVYESLLERNATEARSGAGQYFTPRPLIDCIVRMVAPQAGEIIQDPAAGTGGFLCSASDYLAKSASGAPARFEGVEIERDTYRLCLMNFFLHTMDGLVVHGDALTHDADVLARPDVVLANPPFGSAAGGARAKRADLPFPTSNKQLMFLQHIYRSLKDGGRAAVIVPDNVLFESGIGRRVRQDLMAECDLHTLLRLPQGIFYAQSINTNVLFFTKGRPTTATRIFDMRSNSPRFGKRRPVTDDSFVEFEEACAPDRGSGRSDRLRTVAREEIQANEESWDILGGPGRPAPSQGDSVNAILAELSLDLRSALERLEAIEQELTG